MTSISPPQPFSSSNTKKMEQILFPILFFILTSNAHLSFAARTLTESLSPDEMQAILNSMPPDTLSQLSTMPPDVLAQLSSMPPEDLANLAGIDPAKIPANIPKDHIANFLKDHGAEKLPEGSSNQKEANMTNVPKINIESFKVEMPDISLPPIASPKLPSVQKILDDLHVPAFITNSIFAKYD
ncbi:uncharacterized protein A4U43_C03F6060 [Asparagus officinalis]|uniref:Uncharacterized protein n=1 Tax=Asparagus officinalis TaxID=4686 RepID=A0A5P1F9K9_ASPOF|nr:uncharacterized protein LOC109832096 [Asparagus officinalis]ONK74423.1 uncharacterized protein A4U43_C03F6060 [Asparagus officinalis]